MNAIFARRIIEMNNKEQQSLFDYTNSVNLRFNGSDYNRKIDDARLTGQALRVFSLMKDGEWRTLDEISRSTSAPHASVSAQLRHLRKERFGSHDVRKRPRGDRANGLFEYQLIVNK